ncbi:MAG: hypothetical protein IIA87_01280 [Nanoarchaeota archaeon]|nr:hypothetical protein [Nanoarchaeota archaeon]
MTIRETYRKAIEVGKTIGRVLVENNPHYQMAIAQTQARLDRKRISDGIEPKYFTRKQLESKLCGIF